MSYLPSGEVRSEPVYTLPANRFSLDLNNRFRTSQTVPVFESEHTHGVGQDFENLTSGSGSLTHLSDEAAVQLSVGTSIGDKSVQQSHYVPHMMGSTTSAFLGVRMVEKVTDCGKYVGMGDDSNGIFFYQDGTTNKIIRRSSASGSVQEETVTNANWNICKIDGTYDADDNPTSITLDDGYHAVVIEYSLLGPGIARCGFMFGDTIVYAHQFVGSGSLPLLGTHRLPVRYEIINNAASAGSTLIQGPCAVFSENSGSYRDWTASNGVGGVEINDRKSVLMLRLKTTFEGVTNRKLVLPKSMRVLSDTREIYYEVVRNPTTIGGTPTWTSVHDDSCCEYSTSTVDITGGHVIDQGYCEAGRGQGNDDIGMVDNDVANIKNALGLSIDGTESDTIVLVATSFSQKTDVRGVFKWKEV